VSNKYIGTESCYAKNEKVWVPRIGGSGVNENTFWSIIALVLRDYKRGYTYDDYCNIIPMDYGRAYGRILYAGALAHSFIDKRVARELLRKGLESLKTGRLPPDAVVHLAGDNAESIARELVAYGIASPNQIKTYSVWEALRVGV